MTEQAISLKDMSIEEMATLTERVILALCSVQESLSDLFSESRSLLEGNQTVPVEPLQRVIVAHVLTCGDIFLKLEQQRELLMARPSGAAN